MTITIMLITMKITIIQLHIIILKLLLLMIINTTSISNITTINGTWLSFQLGVRGGRGSATLSPNPKP